MDTTLQPEELPESWGRFASLLVPEVGVRCTNDGWRVQDVGATPYLGLCKARLGRSQYAVGHAESDGSFSPVWQWGLDEDDVGDDEEITSYLDAEVRP